MDALIDSISVWLVLGALFLLIFTAVLTILGTAAIRGVMQNLSARLKISTYNNFQYNNRFSLTIEGKYYEHVCVDDVKLMETTIVLLSDNHKTVSIPNYDFVKLYKLMHPQTLDRASKGN